MKKSNFRPVGANSSRRNTLKIERFAGVDYSSQKLEIKSGRAIDILNYIYKDGVIQKRHGFEEIFQLQPTKYVIQNFDGTDGNVVLTNDVNFNGIWSFLAEDGKRHVIAHIGKLLYELIIDYERNEIILEPLHSDIFKLDEIKQYPICYEYENFKSQAFIGENKLWFLGGNKFMCIRFFMDGSYFKKSVTPVEDISYIPTTTIGITKNGSKVSGRSELDKVNLLNHFRINKLLSGTEKDETLNETTKYNEYILSSPLIIKNEGKDMADFSMTIEERGKIKNG